eukprot:2430877-Amphidinium_carterae.1
MFSMPGVTRLRAQQATACGLMRQTYSVVAHPVHSMIWKSAAKQQAQSNPMHKSPSLPRGPKSPKSERL